jgi:hypothetical protein
MTGTFTIRRATASDVQAIERLAALDSASAPPGATLLAEVDDEPWAAVEIESGRAIADPFRPSGDLVELLRYRARAMRPRDDERPRLTRLLARAA